MSWVDDLKAGVKSYFAARQQTKQNKARIQQTKQTLAQKQPPQPTPQPAPKPPMVEQDRGKVIDNALTNSGLTADEITRLKGKPNAGGQ
jgi:ribosome-binding protein aMBF1 (putative translation factor)